jgi:hypothetical protein
MKTWWVSVGLLIGSVSVAWAQTDNAPPPSNRECYLAYASAAKERARYESSRGDKMFGRSIMQYIPSALEISADEYAARAEKVGTSEGEAGSGGGASDISLVMGREALSSITDAYLRPDSVYLRSRAVFDILHRCDVAASTVPETGIPPTAAQIVSAIQQPFHALEKPRRPAVAANDDIQCAARFMLWEDLKQDDPSWVDGARQRFTISMLNVLAANPQVSPGQLVDAVRDAAVARKPISAFTLSDEVNACAARYRMTRVSLP